MNSAADINPGYFSRFVDGRRGEILDAALAVFATKGYEAGTMREIAARLGLTEPALYRHYPGKEAIFTDIIVKAGERAAAETTALIERVSSDNLRESLMSLLALRRRGLSESQPVIRTIMMAVPHDEAFREVFRERFGAKLAAGVRALIPRVDVFFGIEREPGKLNGLVRVFMSLFAGYFMTSNILGVPPDDEAIVDAVLAIMGWAGNG